MRRNFIQKRNQTCKTLANTHTHTHSHMKLKREKKIICATLVHKIRDIVRKIEIGHTIEIRFRFDSTPIVNKQTNKKCSQ